MLAEKPVISDDSNQLDPSLLDELLANIATLSSVYHKPPDSFITRVKITQKTEEEEFPDGAEAGYSESPAQPGDSGASTPATSSSSPYTVPRQHTTAPAASAAPAAPTAVPDLLDLGGENNNSAIVPVDQPSVPAGYVLSVLLIRTMIWLLDLVQSIELLGSETC